MEDIEYFAKYNPLNMTAFTLLYSFGVRDKIKEKQLNPQKSVFDLPLDPLVTNPFKLHEQQMIEAFETKVGDRKSIDSPSISGVNPFIHTKQEIRENATLVDKSTDSHQTPLETEPLQRNITPLTIDDATDMRETKILHNHTELERMHSDVEESPRYDISSTLQKRNTIEKESDNANAKNSEMDTDDDSDLSDIEDMKFGSAMSSFSLESLKSKVGEWKEALENKIHQLIDKKQETQNLTENVSNLLLKKQYEISSYRLPVVIKSIKTSPNIKPPQGLYYISRSGRKIYLNSSQKRKWMNGEEIAGCIDGCSSNNTPI